jgi:hypothetical protein
MATSKTGTFYLTETVTIPAASPDGTRAQGTIDLGAYVNVPTGQAVAIDQVDFIWQAGADYGAALESMLATDGVLSAQLTDLNPGTGFVRADDHSLIASGAMNVDVAANQATHTSDLYPDNFGPATLSEAFMVVNDSLYLTAGNNNAISGTSDVFLSCRIRCRVVKLGQKDWMAIAIQSTASDN